MRRRLLQFSLRTLLLCILACSFLLGIWAVYLRPFVIQNEAMSILAKSGSTVRVEAASGPSWQEWLVTRTLGADAFIHITAVDLRGSVVDATTLATLRYLPHLRQLVADGVPMSKDAIASLGGCPELRELSLRHTPCDDEYVDLLSQLLKLERLYLSGTLVTDRGLRELQVLGNLNEIYVRWTPVTADGAAEFEHTRPKCKVYFQTVSDPR